MLSREKEKEEEEEEVLSHMGQAPVSTVGRSRNDGNGREHVGFDVYMCRMNAQTVAGGPDLDSIVFFLYLCIKLVST